MRGACGKPATEPGGTLYKVLVLASLQRNGSQVRVPARCALPARDGLDVAWLYTRTKVPVPRA